MNNETQFLNRIKLNILDHELKPASNYENYITDLFLNGCVKCISVNELRNLIDTSIQNLRSRNCYNENLYYFFLNIKKQIVLNDLSQIYDKHVIDIIRNHKIKDFNTLKDLTEYRNINNL